MLFRKAYRWRLTSKVYNLVEIAADCDKCLVSRILKDSHCLRSLVPKIKTNDRYQLRNNNNNYVKSLSSKMNNTSIHSFQEILNRYFLNFFIQIVFSWNYSLYTVNFFM